MTEEEKAIFRARFGCQLIQYFPKEVKVHVHRDGGKKFDAYKMEDGIPVYIYAWEDKKERLESASQESYF